MWRQEQKWDAFSSIETKNSGKKSLVTKWNWTKMWILPKLIGKKLVLMICDYFNYVNKTE